MQRTRATWKRAACVIAAAALVVLLVRSHFTPVPDHVAAPAAPPAAPPRAAPARNAPVAVAPAAAPASAAQRLMGGAKKAGTRIAKTILLDEPPAPKMDPVANASRALERNEARFGRPGWARSMRPARVQRLPAGTAVSFDQEWKDVPVLGGGAIVLVDRSGSATYGTVRVLPTPPPEVSAEPAVDEKAARTAAESDFAVEDGVQSGAPGLFIAQDGDAPILAWLVPVSTWDPFGSSIVTVDAATGDVIESRDVLQSATGRCFVFRPNPVASTGNTNLRDDFDRSSDVLNAALVDQPLDDLDGSGFLRGPLVDVVPGAGADRVLRPDLQFLFTRNDTGFEQSMCYAYLQSALSYAGTLGFPNVLNRTLVANARSVGGDEDQVNAFFDPLSGQLFFGTEGVDLAEDATVILHELGHAIQDAQASKPLQPFGSSHQSASMGEGFGDYWSVSLLQETMAFEPTRIGHWVAIGDKGFPFATDAFERGLFRSVDTDKVWPRDADPGRDPHLDGEIWSGAIFDIRERLGKDDANKLVLTSHPLLLPDASFQEGSQALIAANDALFGGARKDEIQAILEARGLFDPAGTIGDDRFEDNDDPIEATDILEGGTAISVENLVSRDDDWYWIPVPVGGVLSVQIQFVNANGDLDLGLGVLDFEHGEIVPVDVSAGEADIEGVTADTRRALQLFADDEGVVHFFALVTPFQGAVNDYSMQVEITEPAGEEAVQEVAVGDTFNANMDLGDVDVVAFEGVKGMKLSVLTRKTGRTGALVEAQLEDDAGVVTNFGSGLSPRGTKQVVVLPATGSYELFLRGSNGASGPYSVRLVGKSPKARVKQVVSFANDDQFVAFPVDALAGSRIIVTAAAKGKNAQGGLLTPIAAVFDSEGEPLQGAGGTGPKVKLDALVGTTGTFFAVVFPAEGSSGNAVVTAQVRPPRSKRVLQERTD